MAKVSFIIPTLNRVRYVGRAVASCVAAGERAGVPFEVVVLDSESDDGSWEMLTARFGADARVLLRQNKRGLGPTRSWLDGAAHVTGDVVTFIWSDDYVAETMLVHLLPALEAGGDLAIGQAIVRDAEDNSAFPDRGIPTRALDPAEIAGAYYGVSRTIAKPPASPACALFSRRAFDRWMELVLAHAEDDPLVHQLMWRRAIGPDLLLFLVALDMQRGAVTFAGEIVAQFSSHDDSITISSPEWLLRGGYLAARMMALRQAGLFRSLPRRLRGAMLARTALQSIKLARGIPDGVRGLENKAAIAAQARGYARAIVAQAGREAGWPIAAASLAAVGLTEIRKPSHAGKVSMAALA